MNTTGTDCGDYALAVTTENHHEMLRLAQQLSHRHEHDSEAKLLLQMVELQDQLLEYLDTVRAPNTDHTIVARLDQRKQQLAQLSQPIDQTLSGVDISPLFRLEFSRLFDLYSFGRSNTVKCVLLSNEQLEKVSQLFKTLELEWH